MKIINSSKARIAIFVLVALAACGPTSETEQRSTRVAVGDVEYGGLFRMNITDDIRSIFPHNIVDASAFNIMNQVYEGLVKIDKQSGDIVPALAERYELSADGRTYRFFLREGVMFHEDKIFGDKKTREMTPQDVALCFRRLCEPHESNQLYAFVIDVIKGGRAHYEKGEEGINAPSGPSGIRVTDEGVLEIELEFPLPNFLTILTHPCCWIFPQELYQYGKEIDNWAIGTGPFRARTVKINDVMIMERNHNYWKVDEHGNQLPYLDAVRCNFLEGDRLQLETFFEGNLDLILHVPYDKMAEIESQSAQDGALGVGFNTLSSPGLRVEYYGFQHRSDIYGNEDVRRAFNHAIDRDFLVDSILEGYGIPARYGFVPGSMPGFESRSGEGFYFDPDTARMLLRRAGYASGAEFPVVTIQLNDGSETALEVADEIQRMLTDNLGLTVELAVLPRDRHYDKIEQGSVEFWRDGWIADYPDPENFLKLFHGKLVPEDSVKASYLNTVRFTDPDFDRYFEGAMREPVKSERTALFLKADAEIINRAAVMPLYYEKWIWLTSERVRNLTTGPMGELDLSKVYFKKEG